MVDIRAEARRYSDSHPYEFVRLDGPNDDYNICYRLKAISQPDPRLALLVGDFVHNLRTSLDHVLVACTTKKLRKSASFPIHYADPLAKDSAGEFVVKAEARASFIRALKGIDQRAGAAVILAQPYNLGPVDANIFGVISRLDNADKHKTLIVSSGGLKNMHVEVRVRGQSRALPFVPVGNANFAQDDTVICWQLQGPEPGNIHYPTPSEVYMEYSGTAVVLVHVPQIGGNKPPFVWPLALLMRLGLHEVRSAIRALEPYVIR